MKWHQLIAWIGLLTGTVPVAGQDVRPTPTYRRIQATLDAIPAIDTHDHHWPFERLPGSVQTDEGRGMTLYGLWRASYFRQIHSPTPRRPGEPFADWWARARHDFDDARATGFYRYQFPAFRDLYGIDFDRITDEQAATLDARIFANSQDERWIHHVVTERANIELMLNDPYWGRLDFTTHYPFEVLVFNVTTLLDGFHPSEFRQPSDDPYRFAREQGLEVASLDDYLAVLDRLFRVAKEKGAVCLKTTKAYERTLRFEDVPRERAAWVFGRPRSELSAQEVKDFQDFVMWRLVELSVRYDLPFQIHTGHGRLQGSNPLLLVDLVEANPRTKFILFHGGYSRVGETGAIVLRHGSHVWVDSVWLPTISPTMARRALHEWLEVMPSDRLMWGADCNHAEGIYGATVTTRRVLVEVLAEKVERGELLEEHALRIGRQVLRGNALKLFPQLQSRLRDGPEGLPERGHGLSTTEAEAGWLALFDGATDFGWADAGIAEGLLAGGCTTTAFGRCELRAVVEHAGTIRAGGRDYRVEPGPWSLPDTESRGPIRLADGAAVRMLAARPRELSPIFNGRDLEGWSRVDHPRVPAERRPSWHVSDGVLRVEGGPGALEYRGGRFADLVLQVTARTRSRSANAGVFFRCRPGALLEGYEAQIYNASLEDDPARPTRYATGAIDDRQNARRLISRDLRPFTLTIIAAGPHLATWVNGYQVTDWTDDRPADDNPRQGLRTEHGTIQLQAHDPQTDVEFRSIRVGGLDVQVVRDR